MIVIASMLGHSISRRLLSSVQTFRLGSQTPPRICYAPSLAFKLLLGKSDVIALTVFGRLSLRNA